MQAKCRTGGLSLTSVVAAGYLRCVDCVLICGKSVKYGVSVLAASFCAGLKPVRTARRAVLPGVAAVAAILLSGCALAGTWRVTEWEPRVESTDLKLSDVTFGSGGRYTATETGDGGHVTSTGRYRRFALWLTLVPDDDTQPDYRALLIFTGKLVLRRDAGAGSSTLTLRRRR